jgi:ubiquinone/menaquinone biosynthesis C-methylase UbiE
LSKHHHHPPQPTAALPSDNLLPLLYAMDQEHGWSQGMRAITHALLGATRLPPGPLLEVGCGAGVLLRELYAYHRGARCFGLDYSSIALDYAKRQPATLHLSQGDLQQLPFGANHFSLIVALDSFDQRAVNLQQAVRESWRLLRPDGLLLLRVSAHPWLESEHDVAFNTGRRYARQELMAALSNGGFHLERVTYANTLLALPVIAQRLLQRWRLLPFESNHEISPVVNQQVARLLRWEANLLHLTNLPFGISLYVLARKPI